MSNRLSSKQSSKRTAEHPLNVDYTNRRKAVPLQFRLEVRSRPSNNPQFQEKWFAGTETGIEATEDDSSNLTLERLQRMIVTFLAERTPDHDGKVFVPSDINNVGAWLYVRTDRPAGLAADDMNVPTTKYIATDEALKHALNNVAYPVVKTSRSSSNKKSKVACLMLDVLVVGKKRKPAKKKQTRVNDDDSVSHSTGRKPHSDDKDITFDFHLLYPTFTSSKQKQCVLKENKQARKDSFRMAANGLTRVQAIDVIKEITDAAFYLDAYKMEDNTGETVTLIPKEAKLYYRRQATSKNMTALLSTEDMWKVINTKKKSVFTEQIEAGVLFFSLGARDINSIDDQHAPVDAEYLLADDIGINYTQSAEEFASPVSLPKDRIIPVNQQRRSNTWSTAAKEEAVAFVKGLYSNEQSKLYHGFHEGHQKLMVQHFSYNNKYGDDGCFPIWLAYDCEDGDDNTWPSIYDLAINFGDNMLDRFSHGSVPEREAFKPDPNSPDDPPKIQKQSEHETTPMFSTLAKSMESLGDKLITAATRGSTPASAARVIIEETRLVTFEFIRVDEKNVQLSISELAKSNEFMGDVIERAWTRDIKFIQGVFSLIPEATMQKVTTNDVDMMFTLPVLGAIHRAAIGEQSVSSIVEAVGPAPRPIPVTITFVEARKQAATTTTRMPLNLFRNH